MPDTPTSNTFYFNNSSLKLSTCSKKYYFQVVLGLRPPPGGSRYANLGTVFHKIMETAGKTPPNLQALFADRRHGNSVLVPEPEFLKAATLAQRVVDENPTLYTDCIREHCFTFPWPLALDLSPVPTLTGTIDLISYDAISHTVDLVDYKTTGKPLDGALAKSYALSSQRPFYQHAVAHDPSLPDKYKDAISLGRLRWRYIYGRPESEEYFMDNPTFVNGKELEVFVRLFYEKALLFSALHNDPSLAVKEGILNGSCWNCPFQQICLQPTLEAEQHATANWYYGRKPYDPRNHSEQ